MNTVRAPASPARFPMPGAATAHSAAATCPRPWCPRSIGCRRAVDRYLHSAEFQANSITSSRPGSAVRPPLATRPTLSKRWGAEVWLKREDLAHTGAHKINNAVGQTLLAKRLGAKRIIAETGAGQHGVASAAAAARLGNALRGLHGRGRRRAAGAERRTHAAHGRDRRAGHGGDKTLRAAIDEALRDWVSDPDGTYYSLGSAVGPHPYPYLVRELQAVIGREARAQMLEFAGRPCRCRVSPASAAARMRSACSTRSSAMPRCACSAWKPAAAARGSATMPPRLTFGTPGVLARQLHADSAGCVRPGARDAFGIGGPRLLGRRARSTPT
jgi:hypothetical protein